MTPEEREELRSAWEYHKAADELLAQRMSYGMVAHSMLIVSFVTIAAADHRNRPWLSLIGVAISLLGFWYSAVQYSTIRSLIRGLDRMKDTYLIRRDPVYADYLNAIRHDNKWRLHQRHVPLSLAAAWVVFFAIAVIFR
jgi:hypothetical protein